MMRVFIIICALFATTCLQSAFCRSNGNNNKVCTTPACQNAANLMSSYMDETANPCDNFYDYACGKFLKNNQLPDNNPMIGSYRTAQQSDVEEKRLLLEQPGYKTDYERKIKTFYKACIDLDAINKFGDKSLTAEDRKNWPTLNPNLKHPWTFKETIEHYEKDLSQTLFEYYLDINKNRKRPRDILGITLSKRKDLTKGFVDYYVNFTRALGASDENTARKDSEALVKFMEAKNKLILSGPESRDPELTNNIIKLGEIQKRYNYFTWKRLFRRSIFENVRASTKISDNTLVNVLNTKYFEKLGQLMNDAGERTIQNYFAWKHADSIIADATDELRNITFNYRRLLTGQKESSPWKKRCLHKTNRLFDVAITKLISETTFTPEMKKNMDEMIGQVKYILKQVIKKTDWMQASTIETNLKKMRNMKENIGIWSQNWNDASIDELYKHFQVTEDMSYTEMLKHVNKQKHANSLQNFGQSTQDWKIYRPSSLNAWAYHRGPSIVFTLPILRSPFYNGTFPNYLSYGGIGMVIGHEILHHFDKVGRKYDENGRYNNIWGPAEEQEYEKRADCFVKQYDNIFLKQIKEYINGTRTISEVIADNGGAKMSYLAYQKYARTHPELPIDLHGLNQKQLFFLSMAQQWCRKTTDTLVKYYNKYGVHPINEGRVNGIMMNHAGFAKAFKCKRNSPMNPDTKCQIF